jgi:glucose-1-phosphate thymidylyltransferase
MKAIIPVAGAGTKLRPHTHTQPKPLIPVAGRPILGHILDNLMLAGIHDFVFIIGYLGEKIEEFIKEQYGDKIHAEFVVQGPREGLAHAIGMASEEIQASREGILIVLGDTIVDVDYPSILASEYSILGVDTVEDPRAFGVAKLNEEGFVTSLVEKPNIPKSNLALAGIYRIRETDALLNAINHIISNQLRTQTEYHLTDALMLMVEQGIQIKTQKVNNWFDCGKKETLLATNRILLGRKDISLHQPEDMENSILVQPVSIAPGVKIRNSIIGPFVAIGTGVILENSIVSNSIIGEYSQLDSIILKGSVVGNDAILKGKSQSVNIGDSTEIDFNE